MTANETLAVMRKIEEKLGEERLATEAEYIDDDMMADAMRIVHGQQGGFTKFSKVFFALEEEYDNVTALVLLYVACKRGLITIALPPSMN